MVYGSIVTADKVRREGPSALPTEMECWRVVREWNQRRRKFISAPKTSHKHNNKDLSGLDVVLWWS